MHGMAPKVVLGHAAGAAPAVKIAEELLSGLWVEMRPLLEAHWREISRYKDIELEPDWEAYARPRRRAAAHVHGAAAGEARRRIEGAWSAT
jgi:hypothetical protein